VGRNVLDRPYRVPLRKMRKDYYSEGRASNYLLEYAEITVAHLRAGGTVAPSLWVRATTLLSHDRPKPSPTTQDTGRCTVGSTDCTLVTITSGGVNLWSLHHILFEFVVRFHIPWPAAFWQIVHDYWTRSLDAYIWSTIRSWI
jgi:hypothetical protein